MGIEETRKVLPREIPLTGGAISQFPVRTAASDSQKVSLSLGDVQVAVQRGRRLTESLERLLQPPGPEESAPLISRYSLVNRAKQEVNHRRRRAKTFGGSMFGEPAWDMLLILYIEHERPRLTVSRLTERSGGPPTTALRWLEYLESHGLIRRESHPTDGRAVHIALTTEGVEALDSYFSETLREET
jgi:DNA-binding MarR family transcriptional regulator